MSFQPELLSLFKPTLNEALQSNWTYTSETDSIATMSADGYFDPDAQQPESSSQSGENLAQSFKVNDLVTLVSKADNDAQPFKVASLDPIVLSPFSASSNVVFANEIVAYAGGAASFSIAAPLVEVGDNVQCQFETQTNPASILTVAAAAGQIDIVASADPGASTVSCIGIRDA